MREDVPSIVPNTRMLFSNSAMQKCVPSLLENSTSVAFFETGLQMTSPKHLLQKSLGGHTRCLHFRHSLQTKLLFFNSIQI